MCLTGPDYEEDFCTGYERGGLYYFGEAPPLLVESSSLQASVFPDFASHVFSLQTLELWHARLGHVNFQYLCLLFPSLIKACKTNKFHCVVCELS